MSQVSKKLYLSLIFILSIEVNSDSFNFNSYNNHGSIGLINTPSARFYDESVFGITVLDGEPDNKLTMTANPFNWLEASFFYTDIPDREQCRTNYENEEFCQGYKDKGFNLKIRLKQEGKLPAIAIGINDIAGTGLYGSEYIVASYGINKIDLSLGLGWGTLNGADKHVKNPFSYIDDSFNNRPDEKIGYVYDNKGGNFQAGRYFSGEDISPFFGISYVLTDKVLLKAEYDSTVTPGEVGYKVREKDYSIGLEYNITENLVVGISSERGSYTSLKFIYKNNPTVTKPKYKYKKSNEVFGPDKLTKLIKNIQNNGIGVNKIFETENAIGIELTQFTHPNLNIIEEIIYSASSDAGVTKEIKKDLRIADLKVVNEFDKEFINAASLVYERKAGKKFFTNTRLTFRPFLASREAFFKGSLLLENDSEIIIKDNLFFSTNLKYSLYDNFEDLTIPPVDTYPAQVRSDVKDYLRNFDKTIFIGRAQFDFYKTLKKNNHIMLTAGILEEMFSGYGMEYLYYDNNKNFGAGFEVFQAFKRGYKLEFDLLDYNVTTGHLNLYYRNFKFIPFDMKLSYGKYLAGDTGGTIEFSRSFSNGVKFGVFATFTDVSSEQFGEGSFDKGLYFTIPLFKNLGSYTWRPLTKDPGQKLLRKNTLHDLLIKFGPLD